MVVVDDSCLQANSQPKSGGLVWGSTAVWRCSTFIKWTEWTLAMTLWSWWQHYKHCHGYYYYYYYWRLLHAELSHAHVAQSDVQQEITWESAVDVVQLIVSVLSTPLRQLLTKVVHSANPISVGIRCGMTVRLNVGMWMKENNPARIEMTFYAYNKNSRSN